MDQSKRDNGFLNFVFILVCSLIITAAPVSAEESAAEAESAPAAPAETETPAATETAPPPAGLKPTVYIVPLGKEFNLKVIYDHPMDFAGDNYIKSIQMEKMDKTFLGLKQFNERAKKAYAEFLVNPNLADFDQVVLVADSSKHGKSSTVIKLEFTPADELPDEYNPQMIRKKALEKAAAARAKAAAEGKKPAKKKVKKAAKKTIVEIAPEKSSDTAEEKPKKKKKRFGLF